MDSTPKHVWIVDDEQDVLMYLSTALEDEDLGVRSFERANGIVDEAAQMPPDLFCLDIMMPDRSGLSLYRELRENPALKDIPVLIVSGYSSEIEFLGTEFRKLVEDESIPVPDGFIEKPVNLARFIGLVKELVVQRDGEAG